MLAKISVIIPIYNAAPFLKRCINSILAQTYSEFECLLINDGSTDNSIDICNEYTLMDNRIRVFDQKNMGVSIARNVGINHAEGEWLTFVDADDWIEPNTLTEAITLATKYDSDIVAWNLIRNTDIKVTYNIPITPSLIFRDRKETKLFILDIMTPFFVYKNYGIEITIEVIRSSCAKLFSHKIYKDIRFCPNLPLAEDALFCAQAYQKANKIVFANKYLYHYITNTRSAVHKYREDIEEINSKIFHEFNKSIPLHFNYQERKIYKWGIIYECINNLLEHKCLHKHKRISLRQSTSYINQFLRSEIFTSQEKITCQIYKSFPIQQRIALFLAYSRLPRILLAYWIFKQKISQLKKLK